MIEQMFALCQGHNVVWDGCLGSLRPCQSPITNHHSPITSHQSPVTPAPHCEARRAVAVSTQVQRRAMRLPRRPSRRSGLLAMGDGGDGRAAAPICSLGTPLCIHVPLRGPQGRGNLHAVVEAGHEIATSPLALLGAPRTGLCEARVGSLTSFRQGSQVGAGFKPDPTPAGSGAVPHM